MIHCWNISTVQTNKMLDQESGQKQGNPKTLDNWLSAKFKPWASVCQDLNDFITRIEYGLF